MQIAVLGIDLGKNSCSVVGLDSTGAVIKRRRMRPESIPTFTEKLPTCIIAMEACCGAHHLGRVMAAQGHQGVQGTFDGLFIVLEEQVASQGVHFFRSVALLGS